MYKKIGYTTLVVSCLIKSIKSEKVQSFTYDKPRLFNAFNNFISI